MSDRIKGAALARTLGASKTAKVIESHACYTAIFTAACEEIGVAGMVTALSQAKNPEWAYYALRDVPDLTEAQRAALQKIARRAA